MAARTTYARIYVDDLDTALPTFEALTGERPGLRFSYRDLELAGIGGCLLVAGTPEALLDGPNDVPTGRNLTIRHPGGAVVEYVEFGSAKVHVR
ncbi:hypothetical protein [Nonomuraea rhodomycinica]|uniref:VOC family protein n=1 Tax=Nonomuraea rhodomycinica TaxID=1712872 RepID=A0A7Y6IY12_9ACTN|nr:hypothetical protein [Nonomuraea rhodomycinica]NUW46462.1 hypothetical protein [Nonomuraea rhodomycinica]